MGSLYRGNESVERYEAFSVLASGCRHLAQTCVTDGARDILRKLADQLDLEVFDPDETVTLQAVVQASISQPQAHCA